MSLVIQYENRQACCQFSEAIFGERVGGLLAFLDDAERSAGLCVLAAQRERVPIGNKDFSGPQHVSVLVRDEIKVRVRVPGIIWMQHSTSLLDRQIRCPDKYTVWKICACWITRTVQEGPG